MTIDDIQKLIDQDESVTLELKKSTGELKDAMHTACAFLNTDGGWLIFGVTPTSRRILGQDVNDNTQREISQALSGLEPAVEVKVNYYDVPDSDGKKLIAIYFDAFVWGHEPYTYAGKPYYRVESTTKQMPRELFEERLRAHHPDFYAWERRKADGIGMSDLNEDRIRGALRLGAEGGRVPNSVLTEPLKSVLDKLQLLSSDGQPNNAAAMLFTKNEKGYYPQFTIQMARFRGTDKNEFIDNQRAYGNFFDLLDAGMAFCFKHLSLSGKIAGIRREEHLEVPVAALREALINALCHRHWEEYNAFVGIAIYDDRLEVLNPGALPHGMTPENIKDPHGSFPYNPIIANVLFKTTFLESWGSGIHRIVDACQAQGLPSPVWSVDKGMVTVTFQRPYYDSTTTQVKGKKDPSTIQVRSNYGPSTPQVPPKHPSSTPQVPPKYHPSTPQVQLLIDKMKSGYMSTNDIMESCGLKDRKYFRESYIVPGLIDHAIERKYPNEPNHPRQMYRLTKQALEWKKSRED